MSVTPEQLAASGTEHGHQAALFCFAAANIKQYPDLRYLFAIPNGGQRNAATGARLKAEGVKAGVPDIMLPRPNRNYHGLFLEMKVGKNVQSTEQKDYFFYLQRNGYWCDICYSWTEARDIILEYLK